MKQNTKAFFAVSIAAIFAISAVSVMSLQEAEASDSHWKFKKQPSFTATLDTVPSAPVGFNGTATAEFWLDKHGEALKYSISIENMDISGFGDPSDDVTKLHLHENHNGTHVLNVYKAPGQDDNDLVVQPTKGIIKGIWDDGDENQSYGGHLNSETFTSQLENLCSGDLFTMIHGEGGAGVLKGSIDPTSKGLKLCEKIADEDHEDEDDDHDEDKEHDDDDHEDEDDDEDKDHED